MNEFDLMIAQAVRAGAKAAKAPATAARPFIRCMGGKWRLRHLLDPFLVSRETYIEPFIGGGAIFFHKHGSFKRAMISDADVDLVNLWREVQSNPAGLYAQASATMASYRDADPGATYYSLREQWNLGSEYRTPALNLFLRSTSFNGLWRQNASGEMNSPWRRDDKNTLPTLARLEAASRALQGASIAVGSFSMHAARDALVYCDPPYFDAETKYTPGGFSCDDLIELLKYCATAESNGCHVVMSNHDRPFVRDLVKIYWPTAKIATIMAARAINSDGTKRGKVPEVVVHTPL